YMIVSLCPPRLSELVADAAAHDVGRQPFEGHVEARSFGETAIVVSGQVEWKRCAAEVIVQIFDPQHHACLPQLPLGARTRHPAEVIDAGAADQAHVALKIVKGERIGELSVAPSCAASSVEQEFGAEQKANASARGGKAVELG